MNQEKTIVLKRSVLLMLCASLTLFLTGCSDNTTDPGPGNEVTEVTMVGHMFTPATIEVEVGTTVRWTNNTSETNTVTSGSGGQHDGTFNSGNISPGGEFTYRFNETGTFDYYCNHHINVGMIGSVTVVEEGSS